MTDVLIAGAGPTGLALGLWLARAGVAVRIIDKADAPGETSRAIAVQARTLEYYRMLGIADAVVAAGVRTEAATVHTDGDIVARLPLGDFGKGLSAYSFVLFFPQDAHERLLGEALRQYGVEVERGVELVEFSQTDDGVDASVTGAAGAVTIGAKYLCGADGAHSTVRHTLGIGFSGATSDTEFFVADVEMAGATDGIGLNICFEPAGFGLYMPVRGGNSIRFIGVVPPQLQQRPDLKFGDVGGAYVARTRLQQRRVNWFSRYRISHRVADRFASGRVFLLGDAGHIHSPAGGQGMNTGLGDAVNLGWKLADVLRGRATPALLDSYEPERRAFALTLVRTTDRVFNLVAGRNWPAQVIRRVAIPYLIPQLMRFGAMRRTMFSLLSQIRVSYRDGPLGGDDHGRLRAGDRLPWVEAAGTDNFATLDGDWQVQVYGGAAGGEDAGGEIAGFRTVMLPFGREAQRAGLESAMCYLLRPDGHVGLIAPAGPEGEAAIAAFARRWGLRPGPAADQTEPSASRMAASTGE